MEGLPCGAGWCRDRLRVPVAPSASAPGVYELHPLHLAIPDRLPSGPCPRAGPTLPIWCRGAYLYPASGFDFLAVGDSHLLGFPASPSIPCLLPRGVRLSRSWNTLPWLLPLLPTSSLPLALHCSPRERSRILSRRGRPALDDGPIRQPLLALAWRALALVTPCQYSCRPAYPGSSRRSTAIRRLFHVTTAAATPCACLPHPRRA